MDYDVVAVKKWKENIGFVGSIHGTLSWIASEYRQTTTVAQDAYCCLVFASCYRSWKELKNVNHLFLRVDWEWKELELLTLFETEYKLNDTEISRKIRAKAVIEATIEWNEAEFLFYHAAPLPVLSALEKFIYDEDHNSWKVLASNTETNLKNMLITPEHAVVIACHLIDQDMWYHDATPILEELCTRSRSPRAIRHLCERLQGKLTLQHECPVLVDIFNMIFPHVDSAKYHDLVPILGNLLVQCNECTIQYSTANRFFQIVRDLVPTNLVGKEEESLNNILYYTKYILQHADELHTITSDIEPTLNSILSVVKEHIQHPSSTFSILHPDVFTIQRPRLGINLIDEPAWVLIDDYNKKLKDLWGIPEDFEYGDDGLEYVGEHIETTEAEEHNKEAAGITNWGEDGIPFQDTEPPNPTHSLNNNNNSTSPVDDNNESNNAMLKRYQIWGIGEEDY